MSSQGESSRNGEGTFTTMSPNFYAVAKKISFPNPGPPLLLTPMVQHTYLPPPGQTQSLLTAAPPRPRCPFCPRQARAAASRRPLRCAIHVPPICSLPGPTSSGPPGPGQRKRRGGAGDPAAGAPAGAAAAVLRGPGRVPRAAGAAGQPGVQRPREAAAVGGAAAEPPRRAERPVCAASLPPPPTRGGAGVGADDFGLAVHFLCRVTLFALSAISPLHTHHSCHTTACAWYLILQLCYPGSWASSRSWLTLTASWPVGHLPMNASQEKYWQLTIFAPFLQKFSIIVQIWAFNRKNIIINAYVYT